MKKIEINVNDIKNFTVCPLKYKFSSSLSFKESSQLGDEDLLLGAALKKAFLKYVFLYQTAFKVKHKDVVREFSTSWIEYKKLYSDLGLPVSDPIDKITKAYDALHYFKNICSRKDEVGLINLPYQKSTSKCIVNDVVDLVIIKPINKSKATEIQVIIIDEDIQLPSRTNFISRIRACMQEIFVKRECIGHNNVTISTKVVNLYHKKVTQVSLSKEHRTNYKSFVNNVASAIELNLIYPNADSNICKKCIFQKECVWSSKN